MFDTFEKNEQDTDLLSICAQQIDLQLSEVDSTNLIAWHKNTLQLKKVLTHELLATPIRKWDVFISEHRAHKHEWYQYIAEHITINEMACFLLENKYFPTFIGLLEKIKEIQFLEGAREAVEENIADEFKPVPHASLMRRMMLAVKERAHESIELESDSSLVNRTLIFYYGYYIEPWHLVGSLFATEQMGTHRVTCMRKGLTRMGLSDEELEFTIIHSACDEHHADDWLLRVIRPSIRARPDLALIIAAGIVECLETSATYLGFLLHRAKLRLAQ